MPINGKEIDVVILDLDGTMVDAFPDVVAAANRVREESGLDPLPFEQVMEYVGYGPEVLVRGILGVDDPDTVRDAVARFAAAYEVLRDSRSTLFPGVRGFLERADVRKAVLTNKLEALAKSVLDRFDLLGHFERVCGFDTTGYRKPDGRSLAWVLGAMGVTRHRAVFIGDSVVDLETADNAGVPFVLVNTGLNTTLKDKSVPLAVDRLDELLE